MPKTNKSAPVNDLLPEELILARSLLRELEEACAFFARERPELTRRVVEAAARRLIDAEGG